MIGYLLITYGPKPTGSLNSCKAALQQLRNLFFVAEKLTGKRELKSKHDYAREVCSLDSLPELKALLIKAREADAVILIDTFDRIFSKCPKAERARLFIELKEYSGHFKDIRSGEDIGSLTAKNIVRIMNATSPVKYVLETAPQRSRHSEDKREQTRKATRASQEARAEAANRKAEELQVLKIELLKEQESITDADLAHEANERGLQTTRGGRWSTAAVKRALKRLEDPTEKLG